MSIVHITYGRCDSKNDKFILLLLLPEHFLLAFTLCQMFYLQQIIF